MKAVTLECQAIKLKHRLPGTPLSFEIRQGQIWGVLGPNGVGKTTLLHTLAGLETPLSGRVMLNGHCLSRLGRHQVARQLGLVFQEREDDFPATVWEIALMGRHPFLSTFQREGHADRGMAETALARLGLDHLAERQVSTLSGGERQRLALATLLTQSPGVWLADEPTNHLDLHHQVGVMALMAQRAAAGCAVVMCLHDLNLAARWCSHVLLLHPEGDACWGTTAERLVPEALERLYGQRLATAWVEGAPVFVPVPGRSTT